MSDINLSVLSIEELLKLEQDIKGERERRQHEERAALMQQAQDLAKRHGITLDELLRPSKKQRATPSPKYRNPDNPEETWTGRGKKPQWIQEKLESGVALETLQISKATLADSPDDTARGRKRDVRPS